MLLYEYRCKANGHQFDVFQPVGAAAPPCPICGSETRKVYASVGLVFKGPGFHTTDYRRPASGNGQGDGKPAESGPPKSEKNGSGAGTPSGSSSSP